MPKAIQLELHARKASPISILLLPGWVADPRALPTDKGLDRRKLIKIFQKLVQGVSVVRRDGVLVLEQELDGAREKSQRQRHAKKQGAKARQERRNALCTQEGTAKL